MELTINNNINTNTNTNANEIELADWDLMCPILLDWLEDPIIMPCCGKAVSKLPLHECIKDLDNKKCPNCNKNINNFDILNAPVSLNILNIVKRFKESNPLYLSNLAQQKKNQNKISLDWEGKIDWMEPPTNSAFQTILGKLKLTCSDNKFNFKTLLIPVIDKSGSMGGSPITQCIYSLNRIIDLAYSNPNIITNIITYNDSASSILINTAQTIESYRLVVDGIKANGGTSFTVAFNEIVRVCQELIDPTVTNVTVIFLTDGEDSSTNKSNRSKLISLLKEKLDGVITNQSIQTQIHTIGFGNSHDYDFLNGLRQISRIEGAYRFADPKEDSDSLSNKINSILNVIESNSNIPIKIISCPYKIIYSDCPVYWLDLTKAYSNSIDGFNIQIQVGDNTMIGDNNTTNTNIFNVRCKFNEGDNNKEVWNEWYTHLVDELMNEVIGLVKIPDLEQIKSKTQIQIHLELIEQRTKAVQMRIKSNLNESEYTDSIDLTRCDKIFNVIKDIRSGIKLDSQTNLKLNDLKFEGKFKTVNTSTSTNPNSNKSNSLGMKAGGVDSLVHKMDLIGKKKLTWETLPKQKLLCCESDIIKGLLLKTSDSIDWYEQNRSKLSTFTDSDGLSFFHISCSIGKYGLVKYLCDTNKNEPNFIKLINSSVNKFNKNPLDLSIQNGYWKTCQILFEFGAKPSPTNSEILLRTCVKRKFWKTGEFMVFNGFVSITDEMLDSVPDSDGLVWLSKMKGAESIDVYKAIRKSMVEVVSNSIDQITNQISWADYTDILTKPTTDQIKIIDLLLKYNKADPLEIIDVVEAGEPEKTTLLYMSCERGNLDLFYTTLKYIPSDQVLSQINWQNLKGTSCLWIASCNKHVEIVTELLGMGSDPNLVNIRGDSPLIPTCQKGSEAIVELLLAYGCDLEKFNPDRENAIMVCCRNGQAKLLDLILEYVSNNLGKDKLMYWLGWCAQIDGFNPILSGAEMGNVDCIKVIHKYDPTCLEFRSGLDNKIIKGALPLHLASFYGRTNAVKTLIELGSNINAQTEPDLYTCLHLAIKHGHKDLTRYLLSLSGIDELLGIVDSTGRIPEYYARLAGNEDILEEFFTSKLGMIFSNMFICSESDEIDCANVLENHGRSIGVYEYSNITQINLSQGTSPLTWAILTGKNYLVNKLLSMGSDIFKPDDRGISPYFWLRYLGLDTEKLLGPIKLLDSSSLIDPKLFQLADLDIQFKLNKLATISSSNPQYKMLLQYTPNMISPLLLEQTNSVENHLMKMLDGFDLEIPSNSLDIIIKSNSNSNLISFIDKLKSNKIVLTKQDNNSNNSNISNNSNNSNNSDYWKMMLLDAKINLIKIMTLDSNILNPNQILALYLYTANLDLFKNVNLNLTNISISSPWYGFISCLYQGLCLLPDYKGDCFRAVDLPFDSVKFALNNIIQWNTFAIGNIDWKNSSELIGLKRGMIFIIKSKTGKNISSYSKYPQENEIVFVPGTSFEVTNYYVPDIICLAQENIRNTTFKYNSIEKIRGFYDKALENKSSIIIELTEI